MQDQGTIVGVLVRVDPDFVAHTVRELESLSGVSTFDVGVAGSLGALIEASDLDAAHACLRSQVLAAPGVRAAWPVDVRLMGEDPTTSEEPVDAARTT